ncbi:aminopeptidase N [Fulvitalea axinellae]|uniref:Aminopeptidase N n=1 Tax=Fulvitalea axinellae TaxID=1182444 RepID=A0AAU9DA99_9BACT|nr:aminopeptidase N [Fulvitalea axinellae]
MRLFIFTLLLILSILSQEAFCSDKKADFPELGVSLQLAKARKARIKDINYALGLHIPKDRKQKISGLAKISLNLSDVQEPLALDFRGDSVLSVSTSAGRLPVIHVNGHIIIPKKALKTGANTINVDFIAADHSLNRDDDKMYTLFVPDRASTAFPCFDQPDLKATYELTLTIPQEWKALANGPLLSESIGSKERTLTYGKTQPISTYLFAFTAGDYQVERRKFGKRNVSLLHMEKDSLKIKESLDPVFEYLEESLYWMEELTGVPYPFSHFDCAAIPAFQFGGMEHPGATFFRQEKLFLDDQATPSAKLYRAKLIAHEVTHMWFGNLVTIKWFNEVWLKEVFANFLADKIVNPKFPDINHDVKFVLSHYPSAYSVDRSEGSHPVQQELDNLLKAGSIYGSIIYHKAPAIMRMAEQLVGEEKFKNALREYVQLHKFGNATWHDLLSILDKHTEQDLSIWSDVWVEKPGMPEYTVKTEYFGEEVSNLEIYQKGNIAKNQPLTWLIGTADEDVTINTSFQSGSSHTIDKAKGLNANFILPNSDAFAYGHFVMDKNSRVYLRKNLRNLKTETARTAVWLNLYEDMLDNRLSGLKFLQAVRDNLGFETNPLIIDKVLGFSSTAFWHFLDNQQRINVSKKQETWLWKNAEMAEEPGVKSAYLKTWSSCLYSDQGLKKALALLNGSSGLAGYKLRYDDYSRLTYSLAVHGKFSDKLLETILEKAPSPHEKSKWKHLAPALSADTASRDAFFMGLAQQQNRTKTVWTLKALALLNHPLRQEHAIKYITPGLELLKETQRTGDLFFPGNWLGALFSGHSSAQATALVREFLDTRPDYPEDLKKKILQNADILFRSSATELTR